MNEPARRLISFETIAIWVIAALLAYGVVNARVAVAESQINDLKVDLREIKSDLKELLRKVP